MGEVKSVVSWISPGPKSPETPGYDSIDELIKSSSDSDDSSNSVEILSSDTEAPPPLRIWRIKKEIIDAEEEEPMAGLQLKIHSVEANYEPEPEPQPKGVLDTEEEDVALEAQKTSAPEKLSVEEEDIVVLLSSDEETSASKSDEPVIKLSRVQTSRDHSSGDHRDQNTPEHTEKSRDPVEVEKEVPAAAVNVTIDLEDSEVNKEVPAVNVTIDLEGKVPAVNDTIDLVDSDSDKETQGHPEPVYNIEDSGSDTNSYTEVCQANVLPSSSSSSPSIRRRHVFGAQQPSLSCPSRRC